MTSLASIHDIYKWYQMDSTDHILTMKSQISHQSHTVWSQNLRNLSLNSVCNSIQWFYKQTAKAKWADCSNAQADLWLCSPHKLQSSSSNESFTLWSGNSLYYIVINDSISGRRRPWSDCADAHSDQDLRRPHTPQRVLCPWSGPLIDLCALYFKVPVILIKRSAIFRCYIVICGLMLVCLD